MTGSIEAVGSISYVQTATLLTPLIGQTAQLSLKLCR